MKKFILISFGFLGWAFYEMSGGDEFKPASERLALAEPQTEKAPDETEVARAEEKVFEDSDPPLVAPPPEVTRVSLNLATLDDVLGGGESEEVKASVVVADGETNLPRSAGSVTESGATPIILPSLITGSAAIAASNEAETASREARDIRSVSGSRVNVRGGPGTDFGIVNRLVRGDEVEVLEENGLGWVRMREVETGEEGWMADFLLTSG